MSVLLQKTASQFSEVPRPTLLSTINSLCDSRRLKYALNLLSNPTIQPDYSLYSKLMQLCIDSKADKQGLLVHKHILTNGFPSNLHLATKLIIFYSKVGDMVNARHVFDKMPERSIVSWTALLSGYSQNGYSEKALMVFSEMHRAGVRANQFTYGSALRACTSMMCLDGGKQIQGCIQKGRFCDNVFVLSALVDLHSKCGKMKDACYIFDVMPERDVVSWNAMIGGYAVQKFGNDAFIMFRSMLREGMVPDSFTLGSVIKASLGDNCLNKAIQIHGLIIQLGFDSNDILTGSLIDAYAKCGSVRNGCDIYKSMQKKDIVSCTALIAGYAREGSNCCVALNLFNELRRAQMKIDDVLLCSMLNICANTASLGLGRQIHAIAVKCEPNKDMAMGNVLIDMYSKAGGIEDANRIFDEMEQKNVISWTSLIAGYGKHGDGNKAIGLYKKMEYEGFVPNDVTFLSLLFACSHNGLIAEGWECFNSMVRRYNISPRSEHYTCMVDLFARGGRLEEAYNLICKMTVKPNASLWGAILGGCSIYGNTSLGEVAARHLFDIEPENSVNYVVLASIYAAAGLWDNARKIRKLIENQNVGKNPGCSFFQLTDKSEALLLTT